MSNDTKWIIGTLVVLAGLLSAQIAGVNTRIDDLRADLTARMDRLEARLNARMDGLEARMDGLEARLNARMDGLEARMDGLEERLRNVEIALAKVEQRLLTIERIVLPAPEPAAPPAP